MILSGYIAVKEKNIDRDALLGAMFVNQNLFVFSEL